MLANTLGPVGTGCCMDLAPILGADQERLPCRYPVIREFWAEIP
jgi:hypothetical protein